MFAHVYLYHLNPIDIVQYFNCLSTLISRALSGALSHFLDLLFFVIPSVIKYQSEFIVLTLLVEVGAARFDSLTLLYSTATLFYVTQMRTLPCNIPMNYSVQHCHNLQINLIVAITVLLLSSFKLSFPHSQFFFEISTSKVF